MDNSPKATSQRWPLCYGQRSLKLLPFYFSTTFFRQRFINWKAIYSCMLNVKKLKKKQYKSILIILTTVLGIFSCRWKTVPYMQQIQVIFHTTPMSFLLTIFMMKQKNVFPEGCFPSPNFHTM
jgi:hypothetical protein